MHSNKYGPWNSIGETNLKPTAFWRSICFAALLSILTLPGLAQPAARNALPVQTLAAVPTAPIVFRGDGAGHLCYELYLTNFSRVAWTLRRLEVGSGTGSPLLSLDALALQGALWHPGRPHLKGDRLAELSPGEAVIVFVWVNLSGDAPRELHHKMMFNKGDDKDKADYELNAPVTKVLTGLPAISPPLRGKHWLAANGPSNTSSHRRAPVIFDGVPHIAQRYAYDWVQIDDKGATSKGDSKDNRSYYCYGSEALAVADATVVEAKDGIPQNTPGGGAMGTTITIDTIAGNHVNLDLGNGIFAMYAHLQPGSIRVKLGDKVSRGQLIGLVGNSGNSTEPHLHFQLMDRNSPLGSEGLPYTLDFHLSGRDPDPDHPKLEWLSTPQDRNGEMPMENEIVDF
jgi:hypothetical protein